MLTRRKAIAAAVLAAAIGTPWIGTRRERGPAPRMVALVYTKKGEIRRSIDPSDDPNDNHLIGVRAALADDEIMELFPRHLHDEIRPRLLAQHIGSGIIV